MQIKISDMLDNASVLIEENKEDEKKDIEDYEMGGFDFVGSCCSTDDLEFYLQAGGKV